MNKFNTRNLKIYSLAGIVAFFNFIIFYNFPIFPDEITNNFLSTVNSIYGDNKQWLIESCALDDFSVPSLIYVFNWLYALPFFVIENNQNFRLFHLTLGTVLFLLIIYTLKDYKSLILNLIILLSWPLSFINSFVIIRPEYFIVLMILSLIYSIRCKSILSIIFLLISYSFALNAHAKAIYFSPLIIGFLGAYFWNHKFKYCALSGIIYILFISYKYYGMYKFLSIGCSYEYINNILSTYQVNPFTFFSNPLTFFNRLYSSNDLIRIDRALSQIFLRNNYDIGYLPNIVKYANLINLINMLYIYLLFSYFKKVFSVIKFDFFICSYLFTIISIFILNANKASYDIFMILNLLILLPALGATYEKK
jgi:hypothetical protein